MATNTKVAPLGEFIRYKDLAIEFNEHARLHEACAVHNAFKAEDFSPPKFYVIDLDDIEFDYEDLGSQPRTDSLNEEVVNKYYHQAIEGVQFGSEHVHGIRTAIIVAENPSKGSSRFIGLCGHHRFAAATKAAYKHIVVEIKHDWWDLSEEEQQDFLMGDNEHPNNGARSNSLDIQKALGQRIGIKSWMTNERTKIKALQKSLERSSNEEMIANLEKEVNQTTTVLRDDLARCAVKWSGGSTSLSTAKRWATTKLSDWHCNEVTKIYIPTEEETKKAHNKQSLKNENGVLSKIFTSPIKSSSVDTRPLLGKLWQDIHKHLLNKKALPSRYQLTVTLKSAASHKALLEHRVKLSQDLADHFETAFPTITVECLFMSQIRGEGKLLEEKGALYSLQDIEDRLKNCK